MSSVVDIWTYEFARLREKNAKSSSQSATAQIRREEEKKRPSSKSEAVAADKAVHGVAFSEAAVFMLMDRFAPI